MSRPHRRRVDAVVLTGGSAFGLAACDGVMRWCEERGIGYPTGGGPVPIVVGLVLYDLVSATLPSGPGPAEGYAACEAAEPGPDAVESGPVGAGTGATVGKWAGPGRRPAGRSRWRAWRATASWSWPPCWP